MEDHPSGLHWQILNPTMVGAVDARRRSPAPRTPRRTNPHSLKRPLTPTVRRTPNANIRAERPVDLGLHDPFLPVMGEIEQFRAPKLRKTQLTAAASHKVPSRGMCEAQWHTLRSGSRRDDDGDYLRGGLQETGNGESVCCQPVLRHPPSTGPRRDTRSIKWSRNG
jgi:hypothetical protein